MGEIDALVNAFFIHVPYDFRFARVGAGPVADVFQSEFGRKGPVTPWGKPALGFKTRNNKKASSKLIVRRRKK